jgi:hypothetical protein
MPLLIVIWSPLFVFSQMFETKIVELADSINRESLASTTIKIDEF